MFLKEACAVCAVSISTCFFSQRASSHLDADLFANCATRAFQLAGFDVRDMTRLCADFVRMIWIELYTPMFPKYAEQG